MSQVVLTKIDTLNAAEYREVVERTELALQMQNCVEPGVLTVSAKKLTGIDELRVNILESLNVRPPKEYTSKFTPPPKLPE